MRLRRWRNDVLDTYVVLGLVFLWLIFKPRDKKGKKGR